MTDLYKEAEIGNLEGMKWLVGQGADKNCVGGKWHATALSVASFKGHMDIVQYLVEQGADMEKACGLGGTPLIYASCSGRLDVARYLLEQGANRDKTTNRGYTSLHYAAYHGHLETAKLLMVYGADLNARTNDGKLPIDDADDEEIKQAIRDEPRRRMDEAPGKRATEQDRHPNTTASGSAQQDEEEEDEHINKKSRLDEGAEAEGGKVAEEGEPSEPSDEEDGNWGARIRIQTKRRFPLIS